MASQGFKALDTNHDGSLSYDEIKAGLEQLAASQHHTITAEEWAWIEKTGKAIDTKTPGKVDEHEFWEFANAVFEHFGLCHLVEEAEADQEGHGCDISDADAKAAFAHVDTDNSGIISRKELKTAIVAFAKSKGHTITKDEAKWLRRQFRRDGGKSDGGLDEGEFHQFANAVSNHFQLCHH